MIEIFAQCFLSILGYRFEIPRYDGCTNRYGKWDDQSITG